MTQTRPSPDALLLEFDMEDSPQSQHGKLKIFFGYAAGVGKTYAMLDAAHNAQAAGVDVVVGYIEPHTRPETLMLLDGLEMLAPKEAFYRGIVLKEFDLDAALARKPQLILVDELAHTNANGCRHPKRYSDIEELLRAGIDVYTTINVQHLESLNDIVASITHVIVQERIPDRIFDDADQVELVDIEPQALIERLQAGKIYKQNQAQKALGNFFTRVNLVALREIALRRTADRVSRQSAVGASNNTYYIGEHILICLSASPSNAKVIRTAARMANAFHASFTALFVETESSTPTDRDSLTRLRNNCKLAEQLGAKIVTVQGDDVPLQIAEYAQASGVSKIIIGRSNNKRRPWHAGPNFVEKLTQMAPNVDIYIIPDASPSYAHKQKHARAKNPLRWIDLIKMLLIMAACTGVGFIFDALNFREANIITVYILGILLTSNQTRGRIYGITASILGVLLYNFFFTDPRYTLHAYGAEYPVTFLIMLIAALITSTLTMRVKNQAAAAAVTAHRTQVLLETSKRLQRTQSMDDIVEQSSQQLRQLTDRPIIVYTVKDTTLQPPRVFAPSGMDVACYTLPDEQAVAAWVVRNNEMAGISTDTLPGASALYLPVSNREQVFAVIGIALDKQDSLGAFERSLLAAMLTEISFAMEKYTLDVAQKEAALQAEREGLRANLLRAISHDLRTPLTSISGNANVLLENSRGMDAKTQHALVEDIYDDSLWLINLVENLLAVTRIDQGTLNMRMQPELVEEIFTEALNHVNRKSVEHTITTRVHPDLLMARVDARLIVQVVINIVDNAIKYTPPGSHIDVRAFVHNRDVVIEVADDGPGISDADKEQIFDMFFTAHNNKGDSRRGLGLGLALCKSIIVAMGGEIYVRDNKPRGTILGFSLQLAEVKEYAEQ